jgi:hypothetical protein
MRLAAVVSFVVLAVASLQAPTSARQIPRHLLLAPSISPDSAFPGDASLDSVSADSPTDAWAVGAFFDPGAPGGHFALAEHWDGTAWSIIPVPYTGNQTEFSAVSALSPTDAWAVGFCCSTPDSDQVLIEHWDGASWSVVSSPSPGASGGDLYSVSATSQDDAWAAGTSGTKGFLEHWNGSSWKLVSDPAHANFVDATSSTDVWASGTSLEHWDGHFWTITPTQAPPAASWYGTGAISGDYSDAWVVGTWADSSNILHSLAEHWNGSSWSIVSTPDVGTEDTLIGVSESAPNDVWALDGGFGFSTTPCPACSAQVLHYDGSAWSLAGQPVPSSDQGDSIYAMDARSSSDVWVVGMSRPTPDQPMIGHFDGSGWSNVSTPTPPVITSIGPDTGTASGGTKVTIRGLGFLSTAKVKFGRRAGRDVQILSRRRIEVISPPGRQTVNVRVLLPEGAGARSPFNQADRFTYR